MDYGKSITKHYRHLRWKCEGEQTSTSPRHAAMYAGVGRPPKGKSWFMLNDRPFDFMVRAAPSVRTFKRTASAKGGE